MLWSMPERDPELQVHPDTGLTAEQEAQAAGLRYVTDDDPGWSRKRNGRGFHYFTTTGKPLRDERGIKRIQTLAIPPAWEEVWICPYATGHLQAVGRDDAGRKQYRYHDQYKEYRSEAKFHHILDFAKALPVIRERVERDLRKRCLSREKVLAVLVRLLETTHIRIGNTTYARDHGHYGLTTLRDKHVEVHGQTVEFEFVGKSGKEHHIELKDAQLARSIERCCDIPGYEIFKYVEENKKHIVDSGDVNDYLREITGGKFTAKHFRTWAGTVICAVVLHSLEPWYTPREAEKNVVQAVKVTSRELGNTPATCRAYYIHPTILEAYADGSLLPAMDEAIDAFQNADAHGLKPEEAAVLAILQGS